MKPILPVIALIAMITSACKQELPAKLDEENVFGTVQEIQTVQSEKQLIYQIGQDPYKSNWGTATGYYIKVEDQQHPVLWDEAEKLKDLKVGDKVNLHPSEFVSCTGENDLRPKCHRMMRVYKSSRRINPLGH